MELFIILFRLLLLVVVGVTSCVHFGAQGLGIVAAVWLIMPADNTK